VRTECLSRRTQPRAARAARARRAHLADTARRAASTQEEEVHVLLTVRSDADIDAASDTAPVRVALSVQVPQVQALKMELSRVTGSVGSALVRARVCWRGVVAKPPWMRVALALTPRLRAERLRRRRRRRRLRAGGTPACLHARTHALLCAC
jgi:hypothetical protein